MKVPCEGTLPEANIKPLKIENQWLEDDIFFWEGPLSGVNSLLVAGSVIIEFGDFAPF